MTGSIRNPHVRTLCTLALADESSLQFALPDHLFGFVAQQSCEKLIKALISSHNISYPFIHNLEALAKLLGQCGDSLPTVPFTLADLDPYAVELRYDFGDPLSDAERLSIRETVAILRQFILTRIIALEAATPISPSP